MMDLNMGISPCPNDTFIFHAMIENAIDTRPFAFKPSLLDVQELNRLAFEKRFDITKLSFYAWLKLRDAYEILDSGSALGRGCGPLLVARSNALDLTAAKVAIPGELTTAFLLLRLWNPDIKNVESTRFDAILNGVQTGRFDAGLVIHEGRFVYEDYDCVKIIDLGDWWERETQMPIPLGCIALKKEKPVLSYKDQVEEILAKSIGYAFENPEASREFVKTHAREMDENVMARHIDLYVNEFTLTLGDSGREAIRRLEEMAACQKII